MIDPKERAKLKELEGFINRNILGQPEVVREMVPILVNGELGLNSQGKPKANLLGLGPPGVGKTEICNAFTDYLLGRDKLVRFDMSEYQTQESIYCPLGTMGRKDYSDLTMIGSLVLGHFFLMRSKRLMNVYWICFCSF